MKLKLAVAGSAAAAAALATTLAFASAAGGEPPGGVVPIHQHYVVDANGALLPVGPDACNDGPSKQFDNFHFNIHLGMPFANGIISFSGCPTPES
jgi:hypothetical protein